MLLQNTLEQDIGRLEGVVRANVDNDSLALAVLRQEIAPQSQENFEVMAEALSYQEDRTVVDAAEALGISSGVLSIRSLHESIVDGLRRVTGRIVGGSLQCLIAL